MTTSSHETLQSKPQQLDNGLSEHKTAPDSAAEPTNLNPKVNELGGPKGPEPTRFGDWERKGRCVDF